MKMMSLDQAAEALSRECPCGGRNPYQWEVAVLEWREDERMVAECDLWDPATERTRRRVIAKWYADGRGKRTFDLMQRLSRQLEDRDDRNDTMAVLAVPRALFYDPALRLLVQERAPGVSFAEIMAWPSHRHYLRRAGMALAQLHRLRGPSSRGRSIAEHVAELMHPHPRHLAAALPDLRERIEALEAGMVRAETRWTNVPAAWLHRDIHLRQLLYGGGRVWLLDWDLSASGDPALDVGNFLLHLDRQFLGRAQQAKAAFIEGYLEGGDANVVRRAPVFEAFNYLRRACKAFRLKRVAWRQSVARMVAASEQCMARL